MNWPEYLQMSNKPAAPQVVLRRHATRAKPRPQRKSREDSEPRQRVSERHNTKVVFRFECARCGKADELGYVPKTLDGALCHDCAHEVLGSRWRGDSRRNEGHTYECAGCGREAWIKKAPEDGRRLLCEACLQGQHVASPERVEGQWVEGAGAVRKKRSNAG